jgi:hypothetical protein
LKEGSSPPDMMDKSPSFKSSLQTTHSNSIVTASITSTVASSTKRVHDDDVPKEDADSDRPTIKMFSRRSDSRKNENFISSTATTTSGNGDFGKDHCIVNTTNPDTVKYTKDTTTPFTSNFKWLDDATNYSSVGDSPLVSSSDLKLQNESHCPPQQDPSSREGIVVSSVSHSTPETYYPPPPPIGSEYDAMEEIIRIEIQKELHKAELAHTKLLSLLQHSFPQPE